MNYILNEPYVSITFDASVPCVIQVWNGYANSEQFRFATETMIKFIEKNHHQHPHIQCLADVRKLNALTSADMEWAAKEADPKLYKLGLRKMAFITPEKIIGKIAVQSYQRNAKDDGVVESNMFASEEEAKAWLTT